MAWPALARRANRILASSLLAALLALAVHGARPGLALASGCLDAVFQRLYRVKGDYKGEQHGASRQFPGMSVRYLGAPSERAPYELRVAEGRIVDAKGETLDGFQRGIVVIARDGRIYATRDHSPGKFHHSTFVAGEDVAFAGEISVMGGKVTFLSNYSGHYAPEPQAVVKALQFLRGLGMDIAAVDVSYKGSLWFKRKGVALDALRLLDRLERPGEGPGVAQVLAEAPGEEALFFGRVLADDAFGSRPRSSRYLEGFGEVLAALARGNAEHPLLEYSLKRLAQASPDPLAEGARLLDKLEWNEAARRSFVTHLADSLHDPEVARRLRQRWWSADFSEGRAKLGPVLESASESFLGRRLKQLLAKP